MRDEKQRKSGEEINGWMCGWMGRAGSLQVHLSGKDKHKDGPKAQSGAHVTARLTVLTFRKSTVNKVSQKINNTKSNAANTHTALMQDHRNKQCLDACV